MLGSFREKLSKFDPKKGFQSLTEHLKTDAEPEVDELEAYHRAQSRRAEPGTVDTFFQRLDTLAASPIVFCVLILLAAVGPRFALLAADSISVFSLDGLKTPASGFLGIFVNSFPGIEMTIMLRHGLHFLVFYLTLLVCHGTFLRIFPSALFSLFLSLTIALHPIFTEALLLELSTPLLIATLLASLSVFTFTFRYAHSFLSVLFALLSLTIAPAVFPLIFLPFFFSLWPFEIGFSNLYVERNWVVFLRFFRTIASSPVFYLYSLSTVVMLMAIPVTAASPSASWLYPDSNFLVSLGNTLQFFKKLLLPTNLVIFESFSPWTPNALYGLILLIGILGFLGLRASSTRFAVPLLFQMILVTLAIFFGFSKLWYASDLYAYPFVFFMFGPAVLVLFHPILALFQKLRIPRTTVNEASGLALLAIASSLGFLSYFYSLDWVDHSKLFRRTITQYSESSVAHCAYGISERQHQKAMSSVTHFEKAIVLSYDRFSWLYAEIGELYMGDFEYEKAATSFARFFEAYNSRKVAQPFSSEELAYLYLRHGEALLKSKRADEAIPALTESIKGNNLDLEKAYLLLGIAHYTAQQPEESLRAFKDALEIAPSATAYLWVSVLLSDLEFYPESLKILSRFNEDLLKDLHFALAYIRSLIYTDNRETALQAVDVFEKNAPNTPDFRAEYERSLQLYLRSHSARR